MTDIIEEVIRISNESGDFAAPYQVRAALIADALDSGVLSEQIVSEVAAMLPQRPSQFWRIAAIAAANIGNPLTQAIVDALEDCASKTNSGRPALQDVVQLLRQALPSSNPT